jgi:Tfp pilus assembly PilM family ATPase
LSETNKDINSTEKLLNAIRRKDEESFNSLQKPEVSLSEKKPAKKIKFVLPKHFSNKKNYTVGADIGREFIRLVKTTKGLGDKPVLVDQRVIKYGHQISKDSPEFNTLLKSSLVAFCGSLANCDIWTNISTSEVNVYYLKVPRVPKKQLENVVYWTAKKEGFIDDEKSIFDFELQNEIVEQVSPKYSVMVYTAPKAEIEKIKTLFSDIGITLTGITIVPFAIQNIFRSKWVPATKEVFVSLFIGTDFSRIDVYNKENLVMTRSIKTGNSSMVEAIVESVLEKTGNVRLKNEEANKVLYSLSPDSEKLRDADAGYDFKKEEILEMISPVWERLARQVDMTLKHYASTSENKKIEKIYIMSSINIYNSIRDYLSDQLEVKIEFFDPFNQQNVPSAVESLNISEKMFLAPALGLSLSDNNHTPNAIFTYYEKNKEINIKRSNKLIFLSFVAALIICLVALIYQGSKMNIIKKQGETLKKELALYSPILSIDKVSKVTDEIKMKRKIDRQYAQRYLGMAVIGEVSDLTPPNIHLISLKIAEGNASPKADDKTPKETNGGGTEIIIQGIISGTSNMLDSFLSQYVLKLENSPILNQVSIQKNSIVTFKKNEVLHFILNAKIG